MDQVLLLPWQQGKTWPSQIEGSTELSPESKLPSVWSYLVA